LEEAQRFLESSQRNADPLHAAYVLSLVLGLRRGETLGLAWEDVDLDAGEIHIRWQLQRAEGWLVRRPTKTVSSDAVLPLPQVCIDALRGHGALENRRRLEVGPA
jgi:integrase